jgi:integrase
MTSGAQVTLEVPVHQRLKAVLDETERKQPVIVVGERGRPFTTNGFQSRFFKHIRKLERDGVVRPGLTFHGLRHTVGKKLAELGCDTRTIAAVLGHETEAMARHYAKGEDSRRRATEAINKLERNEVKSVKQGP